MKYVKNSADRSSVDVQGLSIIYDDPCNVDVLFANVSGENLQLTANAICEQMVAAGLLPPVEEGVSTTAHPVKLHLTVANSRYMAHKSNSSRKSFDASVVLDEFKDYYFGTVIMDRVSICSLNQHSSDGYYEELTTTALPRHYCYFLRLFV